MSKLTHVVAQVLIEQINSFDGCYVAEIDNLSAPDTVTIKLRNKRGENGSKPPPIIDPIDYLARIQSGQIVLDDDAVFEALEGFSASRDALDVAIVRSELFRARVQQLREEALKMHRLAAYKRRGADRMDRLVDTWTQRSESLFWLCTPEERAVLLKQYADDTVTRSLQLLSLNKMLHSETEALWLAAKRLRQELPL